MLDSASGDKFLSFRTAVILAATIMLLHLTLVILCEINESLLPIEDVFVTITSGLAAAALFYTARRLVGRARKAWIMIAAAMLFNTLGDLSWSVIELVLHQNPFPSVADIVPSFLMPVSSITAANIPTCSSRDSCVEPERILAFP